MFDTSSFLMKLLSTRSVSGHTREALALINRVFAGLPVPVAIHTTVKGSLTATIGGSTTEGVVFAAHLDTLGAMVSSICPDGRLRYRTVGGFTANSVEGEYCLVETFGGELIPGTIIFDRASVHAWGHEKAAAKREHSDMHIRLDMDVSGADSVRETGISVGNYVHFDPRPVLTPSGYIKARHLDDKAGVAALAAAACGIAEAGERPRRTLHFMFTSHEEVGHGGAGWFPPEVTELIAVDMGVIGSEQTGNERKVSICMADSNGPYNYELSRGLVDVAVRNGIPHAVDTYPFYGSDAAASLRMGLDVRHALLGPGVDSSHATERTHLEGVAAAARLVSLYSLS